MSTLFGQVLAFDLEQMDLLFRVYAKLKDGVVLSGAADPPLAKNFKSWEWRLAA